MFTCTVSIIGVYDVDILIQDSEKKLPKKETGRQMAYIMKRRKLTSFGFTVQTFYHFDVALMS